MLKQIYTKKNVSTALTSILLSPKTSTKDNPVESCSKWAIADAAEVYTRTSGVPVQWGIFDANQYNQQQKDTAVIA